MSNKINRRDFIKSSLLTGAALGAGVYNPLNSQVKSSFDTIITNGKIYTGDGSEFISGSIGVKGGKITAIGEISSQADRIIDARKLAVTPGFIDIHTHSDFTILKAPFGDSKIYQGVTTEVGGNCGESPYPSKSWKSIADFESAISDLGASINYKGLVGQGQIRSIVVGLDNVKPTKHQLEKMKSILENNLEEGAVGMSVGLEYAPSSFANEDELVELCKVVAKHDKIFTVHMRNEDDRIFEALDEAINIAKRSGVRLQISHLKTQYAENWGKAPEVLKKIETAHREGVDIAFDRYPYTAFATGLIVYIPINDRQGTNSEIISKLKDKNESERISQYANQRIKRIGGPQNIVITHCNLEQNKKFIGKSIKECADNLNMDYWEFIRTLLISENGDVDIIGFAMNEDNLNLFLSHPLGMPASDGSIYSPVGELSQNSPHPRSYGTFPRFLGRYVREKNILTLEEAIKRITFTPASRLKLRDRGQIRIGYNADLVIFDPATILDNSDYSHPHTYPTGIDYVIVNGKVKLNKGIRG